HHTIGLGAALDTIQVYLSSGQALRFAHGQFAVLHAIRDALALVVLAGVVAGGVRVRRAHHYQTEGQTQADQHVRLLHDFLSCGPTHDEFGSVEINNGRWWVALTTKASYYLSRFF